MFSKSAFSGTFGSRKKPYPVWPYLEGGLYRGKQVKMRSLGWVLIQYGWCPYKGEKFGYRDTCRGSQCEDMERREPPTCQGERLGTAPPSQPPDRTNLAKTSTETLVSRTVRWYIFVVSASYSVGLCFTKALANQQRRKPYLVLFGTFYLGNLSPPRDTGLLPPSPGGSGMEEILFLPPSCESSSSGCWLCIAQPPVSRCLWDCQALRPSPLFRPPCFLVASNPSQAAHPLRWDYHLPLRLYLGSSQGKE